MDEAKAGKGPSGGQEQKVHGPQRKGHGPEMEVEVIRGGPDRALRVHVVCVEVELGGRPFVAFAVWVSPEGIVGEPVWM